MKAAAFTALLLPVMASAAPCDSLTADVSALAAFGGGGTPHCSTARATTGPVHLCTWQHAYRSPSALAAYRALERAVARCAEPESTPAAAVNHPDTYEQALFALGDKTVSVALKDKAATGQSLVILRIE